MSPILIFIKLYYLKCVQFFHHLAMFLSVPQALNFLFSFHGLELDTEWIFSVFIEPLNE